ncbi:hypothetical protein SAMN04488168_12835 [Bacillus sp. 491mf]|uniref:hypothetical protein n=1 Tax=Bacillus sp. 491mf TaxID=1761755 RepID=UPI0008E21AFD|nr:hypothetical protein [Bacillus sp. 491mf]SFD26377.1 hypothetical protein SAMN04488168_12835 [Bacillus sp. 491mf]
MIKHQPDYLIIDFYGDLHYGVQQIVESYITNKKWLFQKTSQYQILDKGMEMLLFYVHYEMPFYQDFSRKFLNIVLADTRRELEAAKRKIEIAGSGKGGKIKKYFLYIIKMLYFNK